MTDETKPWRKVLYEDQGVPDNYTHESFLDEMKKNLHTRTYDLRTIVEGSGLVTQHMSSVSLFVVCFVYMDSQVLSPHLLFICSSLTTVCAYIVTILLLTPHKHNKLQTSLQDLKSGTLFLTLSCALSPVLMTLTETISTDTIYAMTCCMLVASLFFHDYGTNAPIVSQTMSLSVAMFASVCLASRLPTEWHAFTTLTLAFEVFGLWPAFRKSLMLRVAASHNVLTVFLGLLAVVAVLSVSLVAGVLFILLHLFLSIVCPVWLYNLQPYKNNIYGPWDEAVIRE